MGPNRALQPTVTGVLRPPAPAAERESLAQELAFSAIPARWDNRFVKIAIESNRTQSERLQTIAASLGVKAEGFRKKAADSSGRIDAELCVGADRPKRGAADDLPGYTQAQRGTKLRALRISRSALR